MASKYLKMESLLKRSKQPLTCADLYEKPEVRALVKSTDEVSDCLGYMWRRGLLVRTTAPRTGEKSARYAYTWRLKDEAPPKLVSVDDFKKKGLRGLDFRKEPDGAITLISDGLEITVRRR